MGAPLPPKMLESLARYRDEYRARLGLPIEAPTPAEQAQEATQEPATGLPVETPKPTPIPREREALAAAHDAATEDFQRAHDAYEKMLDEGAASDEEAQRILAERNAAARRLLELNEAYKAAPAMPRAPIEAPSEEEPAALLEPEPEPEAVTKPATEEAAPSAEDEAAARDEIDRMMRENEQLRQQIAAIERGEAPPSPEEMAPAPEPAAPKIIRRRKGQEQVVTPEPTREIPEEKAPPAPSHPVEVGSEAWLGTQRVRVLRFQKYTDHPTTAIVEPLKGGVRREVPLNALDEVTPPKPRGGGGVTLGSGLGAFGEFGTPKTGEQHVPYEIPDKEVEGPFKDNSIHLTIPQRLAAIGTKLKQRWDQYFTFAYRVKDDPEFRNAMRLISDAPLRAANWSREAIARIVGNLDREGRHGEYELFRRGVALRDLIARADRGLLNPRALPPGNLKEALAWVESHATPEVQRAWAEHDQLMKEVAQDLVKRGKLPASILERGAYYPHHVTELSNWIAATMPGLPRPLKAPFEPSLQKARGSIRDIDMRYVETMEKHLSRVMLSNATDDFALKWLHARDILPTLDESQRAMMFGRDEHGEIRQPSRHMQLFRGPDGKQYAAYQYKKSFKYGAPSSMVDALVSELADRTERFHVIPREMAEQLQAFTTRKDLSKVQEDFRTYAGWWKRVLINSLGFKFNVSNAMSDMAGLYREDTRAFLNAFTRGGDLWTLLVHPERVSDAKMAQLMKIADDQDVINGAAFFGVERLHPNLEKADLYRFKSDPTAGEKFTRVWNKTVGKWEHTMQIREGWFRMAKLLTDYERILDGKSPVTKTVDIKGLAPVDAIGKIAREFNVDYGKLGEGFREARATVFPFATWFADQAWRWPKYFAEHPGEAAIKFAVPLAGLWYWNNFMGTQKDDPGASENALKEYQKGDLFHINTHLTDASGREIIIHTPMGLDVLPHALGIDQWPDAIAKYMRHELTPEGLKHELLKGPLGEMLQATSLSSAVGAVGTSPPVQFGVRMSPWLELLGGLWSNEDPITHYKIVPPEAEKTIDTANAYRAQYVVNRLIPFLSVYESAERRALSRADVPNNPLARFMLNGPVDWHGLLQIETAAPAEGMPGEADYETAREAQAAHDEALLHKEKAAFARDRGDEAAADAEEEKAQGQGVTVQEWQRRENSDSFKMRRLRSLLMNPPPTLTAQDRQDALDALQTLQQRQQRGWMKRLPKSVQAGTHRLLEERTP